MLKLVTKAVQQKKTHDAAYGSGLLAELFSNLPENLLTKLLTLTTCKKWLHPFLFTSDYRPIANLRALYK